MAMSRCWHHNDVNQKLGSIQENIERTLGTMKRSFKWLKSWSSLADQANIDHLFTASCVLRNILLKRNEHPAEDFAPPRSGGSLSKLVVPGDGGDGAQVRAG